KDRPPTSAAPPIRSALPNRFPRLAVAGGEQSGVLLDDALAHREAEAGAAGVELSRRQRLDGTRAHPGGATCAVGAHRAGTATPPTGPAGADRHTPGAWAFRAWRTRGLRRVAEQVHQHLRDTVRVALDDRARRHPRNELDGASPGHIPPRVAAVEPHQRHRLI